MCVIIHRDAGITLPYNKIKNAILRNRDGFGLITFLGSGEIDVRREYNSKGNDPDFIYDLVNTAKEYPIALHLRYATAGTKNEDNCHPFPVLNKKEHGRDLHFFHNGTMSQFSHGTKGASDTNFFVNNVAKHVIKVANDAYGDAWWQSSSLEHFLNYYASTGSVFTLVDNDNNLMIINKKMGHQEEGWWASNNSYFSDPYRGNLDSSKEYFYRANGDGTYTRVEKDLTTGKEEKKESGNICNLPVATKNTTSTSCSTTTSTHKNTSTIPPWKETLEKEVEELEVEFKSDSEVLKEEAVKLRNFLALYTKTGENTPHEGFLMFKSIGRDKFRDIAGIDSLSELMVLDPDDIELIVDYHPQMAVSLILDLLCELYVKEAPVVAKANGTNN